MRLLLDTAGVKPNHLRPYSSPFDRELGKFLGPWVLKLISVLLELVGFWFINFMKMNWLLLLLLLNPPKLVVVSLLLLLSLFNLSQ